MAERGELTDIYNQWRQRAETHLDQLAEAFFAPLLVQPPVDWSSADTRIVFVGQETMGWQWTQTQAEEWGYDAWKLAEVASCKDFIDNPASVGALLEGYRQFDFASRQGVNRRSPFWRYFRDCKAAAEEQGGSTCILFSNVIRCAVDAEAGFTLWSLSEADRQRYLAWQRGLLSAELNALQPTLILFVTGPGYDPYLRDEFSELQFDVVAPFPNRTLAKLASPSLPAPAYRTYHPGYLNRKVGFAPLQAAIASSNSNSVYLKRD